MQTTAFPIPPWCRATQDDSIRYLPNILPVCSVLTLINVKVNVNKLSLANTASAAEETTLRMMPVRTWRAPLSGAVRPWRLSGWELSQKKPAARERALASER